MIDYCYEKLDEIKKCLELDEFNILQNKLLNNNYSKEEIDSFINEAIKTHVYNENKKSEYNTNNNLKINVVERQKNCLKVIIDEKYNGYLKNYKYKNNNELEIAIIKIAKLFDISTIDAKRIRFENKNYLLEINDISNYTKMSSKLNIEKSNVTLLPDIHKIIYFPLEYISNKEEYFKMILFNIIINNKDMSLDSYGLTYDELAPINTFIYEEKNKDLINNNIIFNNKIIDYKLLLTCIFDNYFEYIEEFIYSYFNIKIYKKIMDIIDLEIDQKESSKLVIIDRIKEIKNLYNEKVLKIYNDNGICDENSLLDFLNKYIEFGTIVNINNEIHKIPFGTLEAEEGRNNKIINYDNKEIIEFLNYYYLNNKERINPTNIDLTQLFISVSSVNDIMNNCYKFNYPLDIFKYKVGSSAEQMEFIANFLEIQNYNVKRIVFSIIDDNRNIIESHFFAVFTKNNKWYYIENALTDFKGLYEYNSFDELINIVMSKLIYTKEINPYKEIDENKYLFTEINKLNVGISNNKINNIILKGKELNKDNAIKLYEYENEMRKKIIEGKEEAYNKKLNFELIKPSNNFDTTNDFKVEYLRLLKENIMNIVYKNGRNNSYQLEIVNIEDKNSEIIPVEKKEKNNNKLIILIIIVLIIIFSTILWKTIK